MTQDALNRRTKALHETQAVIDFVTQARYEDLTPIAIEKAKTFFIDALMCGVAGSSYEGASFALEAAKVWGDGSASRVMARPGVRLPPAAAAFVNGYQIHALEWDGLHEHSVVIALCGPMGAIFAEADSRPISGKDLLLALSIAVDVAVLMGAGSKSAPKFFRPAIAGHMGAAMALAKLRGYDEDMTKRTFGLAYSTLSGTMQAHWEGSMTLAMQVGQAARNAHQAADLAKVGMGAPADVLGGQYGYFTLFEERGDVEGALASLGSPWKIEEMAHKPFPAGRATQAVLTMLNEINAEHPFEAADVDKLEVYAPSLILTLVGRPLERDMTPAYARLCLKFVAPLMLLEKKVDPLRFTHAMFNDAHITALGEKIILIDDNNPDPNALGPQRLTLYLKDGRRIEASCAHTLGAPDNPLSVALQKDKAAQCFATGGFDGDIDALFAAAHTMDTVDDVRPIFDLVINT